ncbi:MAG: hypothetical protein HEQ32_01955 [Vampirovibrio sp.]
MTSFPTRLLAGTTITVSLRNSPAKAYSNLDGWGLVLFLQNVKGSLNKALTWDADHWVLNVGASDLNALTDAGEITTRYQLIATQDADSLVVEAGRLILARSLNALTGGLDARTHEERVLDNIRAVIEKSATKEQHKYMVNGMELERRTLKELVDLENLYASRVAMQKRRAKGLSPFETIAMGYN